MIVMGIDPGPKSSAWAVVECTQYSIPRWVAKAYESNADIDLGLLWSLHGCGLLAVETSGESVLFGMTPQAMRSRAQQLARTNMVAGLLLGEAKNRGLPLIEVPAPVSRRSIGGKANCSDAIIKRALVMTTRNMPRQTNSHTRDAAAAAIVGWRMAGSVDQTECITCD